ncbi:hypothetical protein CYJ76_04260 [Kytococcus schroeteri]|uniref:DUF4352 domain-containing protein n=1 Tax=Kytococcus schroeteri TaxID=138300 RepID=A0A2I1PBR4_9MICO|nr:hypothetical protein [Kytococcus schroeteri]PKZ42067.1 hypothetical protein CYJ76_04260 [Kytococcus schroeteri]
MTTPPPPPGSPDWEDRPTEPHRIQPGPAGGGGSPRPYDQPTPPVYGGQQSSPYDQPVQDAYGQYGATPAREQPAYPAHPMTGHGGSGGRSGGGHDRTAIGCLVGAGLLVLAVLAALFFVLGGFGGDSEDDQSTGDETSVEQTNPAEDPTTPDETTPDETTPAEDPTTPDETTPAEDPTTPDEDAAAVAFGDAASAGDVEITVGRPEPFQPAEGAAGAQKTSEAVVHEVTVTNRGDAPLGIGSYYLLAQSGGQDAERIFDYTQEIRLPSDPVPPGESQTYRVAWGVQDAGDLAVTASVRGSGSEMPTKLTWSN